MLWFNHGASQMRETKKGRSSNTLTHFQCALIGYWNMRTLALSISSAIPKYKHAYMRMYSVFRPTYLWLSKRTQTSKAKIALNKLIYKLKMFLTICDSFKQLAKSDIPCCQRTAGYCYSPQSFSYAARIAYSRWILWVARPTRRPLVARWWHVAPLTCCCHWLAAGWLPEYAWTHGYDDDDDDYDGVESCYHYSSTGYVCCDAISLWAPQMRHVSFDAAPAYRPPITSRWGPWRKQKPATLAPCSHARFVMESMRHGHVTAPANMRLTYALASNLNIVACCCAWSPIPASS